VGTSRGQKRGPQLAITGYFLVATDKGPADCRWWIRGWAHDWRKDGHGGGGASRYAGLVGGQGQVTVGHAQYWQPLASLLLSLWFTSAGVGDKDEARMQGSVLSPYKRTLSG
jgi:hypothetical protein